MKAVLNGSLYDTDTAKLIYEWEHEDDPEYGSLYRTKSGKYFSTVFSPDHQNGLMRIISRKGALIWLFNVTKSLDEAKSILGMNDDDNEQKQLSVRVPMHTYRYLRETAVEHGVSMGAIIENLVEDTCQTHDDTTTPEYADYLQTLSEEELLKELSKEEIYLHEIKKMVESMKE